jgi:hypothetical protein
MDDRFETCIDCSFENNKILIRMCGPDFNYDYFELETLSDKLLQLKDYTYINVYIGSKKIDIDRFYNQNNFNNFIKELLKFKFKYNLKVFINYIHYIPKNLFKLDIIILQIYGKNFAFEHKKKDICNDDYFYMKKAEGCLKKNIYIKISEKRIKEFNNFYSIPILSDQFPFEISKLQNLEN